MSSIAESIVKTMEKQTQVRAARRQRAKITNQVMNGVFWLVAGIVLSALLFVLGYVLINGYSYVSLKFLTSSDFATGIAPQLFNTLYITIGALIPLFIIGVSAAIYVSEYARQGWFLNILRFASDTLTSVPSIVIGLLGFLLFVTNFGDGHRWGFSRAAGILALTILNLPWMLRAAEDALRAVPKDFREASMALGANKFQTVTRTILPAAIPGLVTALLIVAGRIIGETAALIYTSGEAGPTTGWFTLNPFFAGDTLSVHIYSLFADNPTTGAYEGRLATAVLLLVLIVIINGTARFLGQRLHQRFSGKKA